MTRLYKRNVVSGVQFGPKTKFMVQKDRSSKSIK